MANPTRPSRSPGPRGGRQLLGAPSPIIARTAPWLTIMLGSIVPGWLTIAAAPIAPPCGLLMLIGWRQMRPGLLPVWAGFPLGLVDDVFSGQPLGSAICLWSVSMLALDFLDYRLPWRNFALDWLVAAALIAGDTLLAGLIAAAAGGVPDILAILPQIALGIAAYPLFARLIAGFDRWRLMPIRRLG